MRPRSVRSLFSLLTACLVVTTAGAQTAAQLRVFRGTLVHSRVRSDMEVLQDHLIGFDESNLGRIVFVRPASELGSLAQQHGFNQNDVITLTDSQFLMPGLVDTHYQASQYFRAGADQPGFFSFALNTFIPGVVMFANATFAREESLKFVRRTLRFGSTTVSYFGTTNVNSNFEIARTISELGQRAVLHQYSLDSIPAGFAGLTPPEFRSQTVEEAQNDSRRFIDLVRGLENPLVRPSIGPDFPATTSPELVQALGSVIDETGVFVQGVFANAAFEDITTLPLWEEAGILVVNRTLIVHSIYLRESEMEMYRSRGVSISHCPNANLNLNGGILDVRRMTDFGINVALGSDVAGGYSPSVLNEMRTALHASRALALNLTMNLPAGYTPLSLAEGFYMATMGGAQATGLGDTIGNFEVGKQFDALLIDTSAPTSDPVFGTTSSDTLNVRIEKFLYLGDDRNIQNVYVAGRSRFSRDGLSSDLPLRISLVNNSPRIVGSSVSVDVSVSKPTQSLTCHLRGVSGVGREFSDEQDCSSLNIVYPNLNAGKYVLRVVGNAVTGERTVIRRDFRIGGGSGDCTVNLINRGIMVRGDTVSIQFAINGDAASHTCRLDRQQTSQCESPVTYSGLSSGEHSFQVTPQGCTAGSTYRLSAKFTVP